MTDITLHHQGRRLAASTFGPRGAPPVLLLHGVTQCRDTWEEVAHHLAPRHEVWTLDFRGHGHSDWVADYAMQGFLSDAQAALHEIGRPTVVIGHSLGGLIAGMLAIESPTPLRAALLEDPPWYFGDPQEYARSAFPGLFTLMGANKRRMVEQAAGLADYLVLARSAPSPMGGTAADHTSERHLLSRASALHRVDPRIYDWLLQPLDINHADRRFRCPVRVIQADGGMGAALLPGHEQRLLAANPQATVTAMPGCGHGPHYTRAFESAFLAEVDALLMSLPAA